MKRVDLIPAHPSYGGISMLRYWQLLAAARQPDDRYDLVPVLKGKYEAHTLASESKLRRALIRRVGYPLWLRMSRIGPIAHVLDHSWADLLAHLPRATRKVVTVHDVIPLYQPERLSTAQQARFATTVGMIHQADAIIADSNYTKADILKYLKVPEERIHVVAPGVLMPSVAELEHASAQAERLRVPGTLTIGSIGATGERKNLALFAEAIGGLAERLGMPVRLLRAGHPLPAPLAAAIRRNGGDASLVELGRLRDDEIGGFYRQLDVLACPSLFEGFGLPVLEAMAWGVPVVSSHGASLMEVGGQAAIYFDPRSAAEFQAAVEKLRDPEVVAQCVRRGLERAAELSWRRSLTEVYHVYDTLS
jgi:glycosyltransferase involved in cell wall biosynthesis